VTVRAGPRVTSDDAGGDRVAVHGEAAEAVSHDVEGGGRYPIAPVHTERERRLRGPGVAQGSASPWSNDWAQAARNTAYAEPSLKIDMIAAEVNSWTVSIGPKRRAVRRTCWPVMSCARPGRGVSGLEP
jgi:hypothetical protein